MDKSLFNPTLEEFYNAMAQLYPDQTARALAEIRASKMDKYFDEQNLDVEVNETSD